MRKYVVAKTLNEALKADIKAPVHEVFVVENMSDKDATSAIGFEYEVEDAE